MRGAAESGETPATAIHKVSAAAASYAAREAEPMQPAAAPGTHVLHLEDVVRVLLQVQDHVEEEDKPEVDQQV